MPASWRGATPVVRHHVLSFPERLEVQGAFCWSSNNNKIDDETGALLSVKVTEKRSMFVAIPRSFHCWRPSNRSCQCRCQYTDNIFVLIRSNSKFGGKKILPHLKQNPSSRRSSVCSLQSRSSPFPCWRPSTRSCQCRCQQALRGDVSKYSLFTI